MLVCLGVWFECYFDCLDLFGCWCFDYWILLDCVGKVIWVGVFGGLGVSFKNGENVY